MMVHRNPDVLAGMLPIKPEDAPAELRAAEFPGERDPYPNPNPHLNLTLILT